MYKLHLCNYCFLTVLFYFVYFPEFSYILFLFMNPYMVYYAKSRMIINGLGFILFAMVEFYDKIRILSLFNDFEITSCILVGLSFRMFFFEFCVDICSVFFFPLYFSSCRSMRPLAHSKSHFNKYQHCHHHFISHFL